MDVFDLIYPILLVAGILGPLWAMKRLIAARGRRPAAPARPAEPLPDIFSRIAAFGFSVTREAEYADGSPLAREGRISLGAESVYPCRACGQRGKFAFGEAMVTYDGRYDGTRWYGHVCGRCGHMERYSRDAFGGGFFGLMLEDAACMLDVIRALEHAGPGSLSAKMERVLAEHEAVLLARAGAVGRMRAEIAQELGGATLTPFRSLHGATKFLS